MTERDKQHFELRQKWETEFDNGKTNASFEYWLTDRIEELEAELKQQRLLVYSATGGCSYQRLAKALERVREMENDNLTTKE